jgi:hypothetical protein
MTEATAVTATSMMDALGDEKMRQNAADAGIRLYAWAKFDAKKAMFTSGQGSDMIIIPARTKVYVNLDSIRVGASCWVKDTAVDTIEKSYWEDMKMLNPDRMAQLPDHGPYGKTANGEEGWRGYYNLQMTALENKAEYICSLSSGGSLRAVSALIGDVMKARISGVDVTKKVPVVELGVRTSKTNAGYTVNAPVFKIEGWVDKEKVSFSIFTGKTGQKKAAEVAESQGEDVVV